MRLGRAFLTPLSMAFFCVLASGPALRAQDPAADTLPLPQVSLPTDEEAQKAAHANCVEPAPMLRWQDYQGPFSKTVGFFASRLERKSVYTPQFKPGELLCSFTPKQKFLLFVQDMKDPVTFVAAGFNAGLDQAEDTDPTFGHDAAGYSKRFAAEYTNNAISEFFKDFAYPSIFSEDPRYYRLGRGDTGHRLAHALEHVVVAHQEDGSHMFNFSEWLGTTSAVALGDLYHPGNKPGVGPAASRIGFAIGQDMGYDVLREFWPEIAHKFKLPFRGEGQPH
ncbi:MAG TPA: hypothetical protein VG322_08010 [Candidatus Acidoferrales bacterium]|nr:hypothetical protein [Candidatus Acidoferrales bacterium]